MKYFSLKKSEMLRNCLVFFNKKMIKNQLFQKTISTCVRVVIYIVPSTCVQLVIAFEESVLYIVSYNPLWSPYSRKRNAEKKIRFFLHNFHTDHNKYTIKGVC